jgi:hypothetical protein
MNTTAWCERSCRNGKTLPFPLSFTKRHYQTLINGLQGQLSLDHADAFP